MEVTQCAGRVSANTRRHQLRWGDWEWAYTCTCTCICLYHLQCTCTECIHTCGQLTDTLLFCRYDVGRVVVVTGIPKDTVKSKLRKKCSKYGPLEDFVYPVQTVEEVDPEKVNGLIAHVTYKNYADARKAVKTLEGLKLDESVNPLAAILMSKEGKTTSKMTLAKSRLIVRNLSFEVAPKDLQEVFSQYGGVQEVHIPRKPNGHMRGYAFVQFTSYFDAAKALEGLSITIPHQVTLP